MRSILKKIFIDNWQRKILALIIAIITWIFINNSLSISKTVSNIPIKVINLTEDKTIKGILPGGVLSDTISITLTGNQNFINQINESDLEVVLDLKDKIHSFTTLITKSNLISKNQNINLERSIKKIKQIEYPITISRLVKEKIPVIITKPIGEVPKGYQFLDAWPYQLNMTLKGPEEIIKNLKAKPLQLTFNLSDITQNELDIINASNRRGKKDIVSFFIPTSWKKIHIPALSPYPIEIDDDSNSKALRLDFIKKDLIPINASIPVTLFFPPATIDKLNPDTVAIENNDFIKKINNYNVISTPLLAEGVSEDFINIIKQRMHIVILVEHKEESQKLMWNIQAIIPIELEDIFVNKKLSQESDEAQEMEPHKQEEYLRQKFRTYLNTCRLYVSPEKKLKLNITLDENKIHVLPYTQ